jgi:hypothetical protein
MLDQPRTGIDVPSGIQATDPFTNLMNMLSNITGSPGRKAPTDVVMSPSDVSSFQISAPKPVATFQRGQSGFAYDDVNGLRVQVPGKAPIRIPPNAAGKYRDAIAAALRTAGVPEVDIDVVLADYAASRFSGGDSAPTPEAQEVTDVFGRLFGEDQPTGVATGGTQDTQLDQFLQLFGLGGTTTAEGETTPQIPGTEATTGGDVWSNLFSAIQGGETGTGMPGQFGGVFDFLNLGEQQEGLGPETFEEPGMNDLEKGIAGYLDAISGRDTANADIIDTALGNLFGASTTTQSSDLLKELFGEEWTFEGIATAFEQDPQMAMIMAGQLGQQNVDLFTTLISEAEDTRKFNRAMTEFTEKLKVEKQGQQITVLNKMMDITLGQMQLSQTAETNLMNAQIAAMNTALKSKELSQAEQASIRSNLLDAVGLELEEKRINNEQANFLSNQILAQTELALRVRELDQRGESAAADRELEREGMALTERLGLADITAGILGREAELRFGREGLAQERELGFAGIGQREREAQMNAQVALLNAAMQNPYSFAALSSLGGIPGMAGGAAPAAAAVSPTGMFPSLAGLGFQIPETAQAGTTTPAPAFFTGGMPTVGALGELDPASLEFLKNVLAFSGTPPEGLGRLAGAVTPAAGGYQGLGRTFFG